MAKTAYKELGFALRFRELRKKSNLTQNDAAELFNIRQTTVSGWETGQSLPTLEKAIELAKYFRVSLDYLTGLSHSKF